MFNWFVNTITALLQTFKTVYNLMGVIRTWSMLYLFFLVPLFLCPGLIFFIIFVIPPLISSSPFFHFTPSPTWAPISPSIPHGKPRKHNYIPVLTSFLSIQLSSSIQNLLIVRHELLGDDDVDNENDLIKKMQSNNIYFYYNIC